MGRPRPYGFIRSLRHLAAANWFRCHRKDIRSTVGTCKITHFLIISYCDIIYSSVYVPNWSECFIPIWLLVVVHIMLLIDHRCTRIVYNIICLFVYGVYLYIWLYLLLYITTIYACNGHSVYTHSTYIQCYIIFIIQYLLQYECRSVYRYIIVTDTFLCGQRSVYIVFVRRRVEICILL